MKAVTLTLLLVFANAVMADVTVVVTWTPASGAQGQVTGQEVVHDPDMGVAGDEVVIQELPPGAVTHTFTLTGTDLPNDAVLINTVFVGGGKVSSDPIPVVCIAGAVISTVLQICD